jgi:hypothetical protein
VLLGENRCLNSFATRWRTELADVREALQVFDLDAREKHAVDETLEERRRVLPPAWRDNHEVLASADGVTSLDGIVLERLAP